MITITVASYNNAALEQPVTALFGADGGTIGRSENNHLLLRDPKRHVSRVQAAVTSDGQRYHITNLSHANLLLVNDHELEAHEVRELMDGDIITVGLFVLRVEKVNNMAHDTSLLSDDDPRLTYTQSTDKAETTRTVLSTSPTFDLVHAFDSTPHHTDVIADSLANFSVDPFADLLGDFHVSAASCNKPSVDANVIPTPPAHASLAEKPAVVTCDFADLLSGAAHGPALPTRRDAIIPDDFNPFDLPSQTTRNNDNPLQTTDEHGVTLDSLSNRVAGSLIASACEVPVASWLPLATEPCNLDPLQLFASDAILTPSQNMTESTLTISDHVQELNGSFLMPASIRVPLRTDGKDPVSAMTQTLAPWPTLPDPSPELTIPEADDKRDFPASMPRNAKAEITALQSPADPQHDVAEREPPASSSETSLLLKAFIEGANIPEGTIRSALTPELMYAIGQLLFTATQGTVDLIASRALVKREVKADVTMIVVKNNNPLKFLPDGQTALMQMFSKKVPGFMEPVEAMQDAYQDLRAHQVGVVSGMRAALDDVLQRFNPDHLTPRIKARTVFDTVLPAQRKAKMWDLYNELFHQLYAEAQDDFQALFGKAFLHAYENEIERHKQVGPQ
jgi:FHA domain-containing protein